MSGRWLLAALACALAGCMVTIDKAGPMHYDTKSFERDSAKAVNVHLHMGAGELKAGSGASKLMQGYFSYNTLAWKPEVRYENGELYVEQPGKHGGHLGNNKYEWDLRFAQDVPLNFDVNFGAGQAILDLGGLTLKNVSVHMGAGELKLDLRGRPKQDYNVTIEGGVGEAAVHLPADVGIYAEASGGIGEIGAHGLMKRGDHWENEACSHPGVKIHVTAHGGIGEISLIAE